MKFNGHKKACEGHFGNSLSVHTFINPLFLFSLYFLFSLSKMGCIYSCTKSKTFNCVRVIHINGYVEDFEAPVKVSHVTGIKPGRYMLCSSAHLLTSGRIPFRPNDPLEPGRIYFLLPNTIFQSESSPVDLACLMNRLTTLAKKSGPQVRGPSVIDSLLTQSGYESPSRVCGDSGSGSGLVEFKSNRACLIGSNKCGSVNAWKPQLDRIDESFGRSMRRDSMRSNIEVKG
ncbi:hypothetical protein LUZ60_001641 [Juncus effusus]|nr:hypothetical protein LUZ60_001641 [Juncus effusus]